MLSLFKVALFSLISFATLALAMPASEPRTLNAKDLLNDVKDQIGNALAPVSYVTQSNNTADCIEPIVSNITAIITELANDLEGSSLSGSTVKEVVELVADLLKVILKPLSTACGSNSDLLSVVGDLVTEIVALIKAILKLVGFEVVQLLVLLAGNGCVKIILELGLSDLIKCLGL